MRSPLMQDHQATSTPYGWATISTNALPIWIIMPRSWEAMVNCGLFPNPSHGDLPLWIQKACGLTDFLPRSVDPCPSQVQGYLIIRVDP